MQTMSNDLSKYSNEELLLIYKNQGDNQELSSLENDSYSEGEQYNVYVEYSEGGGCFITTAVCKTFGKPDDCKELMSFRHFRDTYMMENEEMKKDVKWYYEVAPKICQAIDAKGETVAKVEYSRIWEKYLSSAFEALNKNELRLAYDIYKNMVLNLEKTWLTDCHK